MIPAILGLVLVVVVICVVVHTGEKFKAPPVFISKRSASEKEALKRANKK